MKKILFSVCIGFGFFAVLPFLGNKADATLGSLTQFEINSSASSTNVNAGGFNPANANFLTDLSVASATTTAPVASSTALTFTSGDVGHWLFIKTGVNFNATGTISCYYPITAVNSGKATLNATVGAGTCADTTKGYPVPRFTPTTVAGVATVDAPTGGTFALDYSQTVSPRHSWVSSGGEFTNDLACTNVASSVCTSASYNFTNEDVGNLIHINSGTNATTSTTGLWAEIVSVSGGAATLDHNVTTGSANMTAGTARLGGAISLNSTLDDDFFEVGTGTNGTGGMRFFIKNGSFTLGETISIAATGGSQAPIVIEGYNSLRGDIPTGTNRPLINQGANPITFGNNFDIYNVRFTGTSANEITPAGASKIVNCKIVNTSTTANRSAININAADILLLNDEFISYRGRAVSLSSGGSLINGCWIHDSDTGIYISATSAYNIINTIISSNVSYGIFVNIANISRFVVNNVTLYGSENTTGVGINLITGVTDFLLTNSIIYGFTTGITHVDTQTVGFDDYNDYYNNDTDVSNWQKGANDVAVAPSFTSVGQVTGTTGAFTAGNDRIVDTSKNFTSLGVVAGRDYIYIVSGSGVTAGIYGISSITTTTNPNDTLVLDIAPGTNTTSDKVYQITIGQNFAVGTNVKALGFPGAFQGGYSTGYMDIGAVQRQEPAGGSCSTVSYVCIGY
jgi:hypothetical protein